MLERREAVTELLRATRHPHPLGLTLFDVGRIMDRLDRAGVVLAHVGQYFAPRVAPARPTQPPAAFLVLVALEQERNAAARGDTEDATEYRRLAGVLAREAGL